MSMSASVGARDGVICVSPDLRPGVEPMLSGLVEGGLLRQFVTTLRLAPGSPLDRAVGVLPRPIRARVNTLVGRRQLSAVPTRKVRTYPYREIVRASVHRTVSNEVLGDHVWWWAERGFDRSVAHDWAGRAPVIYGFELASAETFRAQKEAGGWCVLGQLIAHHQTAYRLLSEELDRFPEAATGYVRRGLQTAARVNALKDEQYARSDLIVANSPFVKATFVEAGIPAKKIVVVPGGAPDIPSICPDTDDRPTGRTVFLSAGTQSIRKGTPYLLEAWRRLQPAPGTALWMAGKVDLPPSLLEALPGQVELLGPLSHASLFERYRQASVLVLPSLCEGFALVILEAMAHGLPVITTPNSGCGTFVEDGVNGWVIPIRDAEALADRMAWCCDNPQALAEMGRRSREKARTWTWHDYARAHTDVVRSFLERLSA